MLKLYDKSSSIFLTKKYLFIFSLWYFRVTVNKEKEETEEEGLKEKIVPKQNEKKGVDKEKGGKILEEENREEFPLLPTINKEKEEMDDEGLKEKIVAKQNEKKGVDKEEEEKEEVKILEEDSFPLPTKWHDYTILCCLISEYYNYGHILHYFKEAAVEDYSSILERCIVADTKNVQLGFDENYTYVRGTIEPVGLAGKKVSFFPVIKMFNDSGVIVASNCSCSNDRDVRCVHTALLLTYILDGDDE